MDKLSNLPPGCSVFDDYINPKAFPSDKKSVNNMDTYEVSGIAVIRINEWVGADSKEEAIEKVLTAIAENYYIVRESSLSAKRGVKEE